MIPGQQFDTYRYKIAVVGNYHELAEFMANVGSLTRIIAPINLTLTPSQRGRKKGEKAALEAKFQIQTYVVKAGATDAGRPGARS